MMNSFLDLMGDFCKILLPIPEESYQGNTNSQIGICTLSSIDLLRKITNSDILNYVSIAGRLLSENKGIDSMVHSLNQNKRIKTLIVCGKEVWGHKAGHSLFKLHENGIDKNGRIINSTSPDPFLKVSKTQIDYFRNEITLVNMINETNLSKIRQKII